MKVEYKLATVRQSKVRQGRGEFGEEGLDGRWKSWNHSGPSLGLLPSPDYGHEIADSFTNLTLD